MDTLYVNGVKQEELTMWITLKVVIEYYCIVNTTYFSFADDVTKVSEGINGERQPKK
jgi:hypothetical protein